MPAETIFSKLTAKSQTVIPVAVRRKLGLKPGDMIRYRIRGNKAEIEKIVLSEYHDDPFIAFTEWSSAADEKAYKDL